MVNAPPLSDRHSLSGSLSAFVDDCRTLIDRSLSFILPRKSQVSSRLMKAMHYSVFNGGKRIRPILALAACRAAGGAPEQAMPAACAVELIHAYSLVHDDLPAMDDDDLRRGKPSCHKAFDEATAILVGDTLQSLAFETLSNNDLCPAHHLDETTRLQLVRTLSQASGLSGMAGGQAMDNDAMGTQLSQQQLELMHSQKTGALINASVRMGSLCAKRDGQRITDLQSQQLNKYSQAIGLAFQV
ncbi:MAG: polyprenyl synthetase family protein, partial [Endozoicomonas sp.]